MLDLIGIRPSERLPPPVRVEVKVACLPPSQIMAADRQAATILAQNPPPKRELVYEERKTGGRV